LQNLKLIFSLKLLAKTFREKISFVKLFKKISFYII